jgi:hypothetical protein
VRKIALLANLLVAGSVSQVLLSLDGKAQMFVVHGFSRDVIPA